MPWHCFQRFEHNDLERGSQNQNQHWGPNKFDRSNHPLAIMVSNNDHIRSCDNYIRLSVISPFTVYTLLIYNAWQIDFYFHYKTPDKYLCLCPPMYSFLQVKHRRSDLLKHELVSTFLRKKFKFGALFHLANLLLYAFFLIFLTSYALVIPTPLDDICELRNNILK